MATITNLPVEVIYIILDFNNISVQDFANFSSTCKHFYQMLYPNSFWRRKFNQRWSGLKKACQTEMHKGYRNFEELVEARVKCKKELPHLLAQMSEKYYHNGSDEYLQERVKRGDHWVSILHHEHYIFNNVILDKEELTLLIYPNKTIHYLNCYLLMDELTSLNEQWKNGCKDDLTNIYYGRNLLPYLRHHHLENVWQEFINRPAKQQLLEEVIPFVIQWFHPEKNVSYSHIGMDLDLIAKLVMRFLKDLNPKHPIFSTSHEQFSIWKYNNIYENRWNNSDGRLIIDILFVLLLNKPIFLGPVIHYFKSDLFRQYLYIAKDGYMDNVPLPVIFQSVARRLGIYCDLVSFVTSDPDSDILVMDKTYPNTWLLSWRPKWLN
ncbi:F-box only protein [Ooceraea biroi]|uniref:F-box only protein n=1 Tax=Ooceraea biroi TaxID=2015173 RepID=A0A026WR12_OOCBI|nr:F-box only protein [Ooceraea biroi]